MVKNPKDEPQPVGWANAHRIADDHEQQVTQIVGEAQKAAWEHRCPTCGDPVPNFFDHIDTECEKWEGLISQLQLAEIGEVEFTELALEAGMSVERIGKELAFARVEGEL